MSVRIHQLRRENQICMPPLHHLQGKQDVDSNVLKCCKCTLPVCMRPVTKGQRSKVCCRVPCMVVGTSPCWSHHIAEKPASRGSCTPPNSYSHLDRCWKVPRMVVGTSPTAKYSCT